jgi:hypothetical protein
MEQSVQQDGCNRSYLAKLWKCFILCRVSYKKGEKVGKQRSLDVVDFQSKGLRRELLRLANFPSEKSDMLDSMTDG